MAKPEEDKNKKTKAIAKFSPFLASLPLFIQTQLEEDQVRRQQIEKDPFNVCPRCSDWQEDGKLCSICRQTPRVGPPLDISHDRDVEEERHRAAN